MEFRKLRAGEVRFVVKAIDHAYRVYDKMRGTFPYQTGELGVVTQDVSEAEAELEAARLNAKVGITVQAKQPAEKRKSSKSTVPPAIAEPLLENPTEPEWVTEEDIADYGDLSDKTDGYIDWKTTEIPK